MTADKLGLSVFEINYLVKPDATHVVYGKIKQMFSVRIFSFLHGSFLYRKLSLTGWTLTFILLFFTFINQTSAQVKIYIVTDLEGISGVFKWDQILVKDDMLNRQACEYFMGDVAAVVRGLHDGGATEIVVLDGHGSQAVIPHLMEPGATYVTGHPRPGVLYGLDSSFTAVVMLGFHAMKGTPDGVLNHTQSLKSENRYWYNGVESGELAQAAAYAGYFGVPVIMATGDEATCREAKKFFGDKIITVAVKKGIAREAAVLYPFEETHKELYEGAKLSIAIIPQCKPYILQLPIKAKMEYLNFDPLMPKPKLVIKEGTIQDALHIYGF
jgi:D-amino peptidase